MYLRIYRCRADKYAYSLKSYDSFIYLIVKLSMANYPCIEAMYNVCKCRDILPYFLYKYHIDCIM